MLKKCANPLCPNAFRVLSQGKLFQMEVDDFVACENQWEDKLKVLQWNEQLAKSGALACSPAHVEELVIHWMTTGSLDYPFARTSTRPRWRPRQPWRASCDLDMTGVRQIGELAVDRESMERVLSDSPQSLQTYLYAYMDV